MKRISFLLSTLALMSFVSPIAIEGVQWDTNFENALRKAQKGNKNIIMYFTGSDWCAPCKALKTDLFETEVFKKEAEDYILLYVDIPRSSDILTPEQKIHNKNLMSRYNKKGVFPKMVVMSPKGKILDEHSGYGMNGDVQFYLNFLRKNK